MLDSCNEAIHKKSFSISQNKAKEVREVQGTIEYPQKRSQLSKKKTNATVVHSKHSSAIPVTIIEDQLKPPTMDERKSVCEPSRIKTAWEKAIVKNEILLKQSTKEIAQNKKMISNHNRTKSEGTSSCTTKNSVIPAANCYIGQKKAQISEVRHPSSGRDTNITGEKHSKPKEFAQKIALQKRCVSTLRGKADQKAKLQEPSQYETTGKRSLMTTPSSPSKMLKKNFSASKKNSICNNYDSNALSKSKAKTKTSSILESINEETKATQLHSNSNIIKSGHKRSASDGIATKAKPGKAANDETTLMKPAKPDALFHTGMKQKGTSGKDYASSSLYKHIAPVYDPSWPNKKSTKCPTSSAFYAQDSATNESSTNYLVNHERSKSTQVKVKQYIKFIGELGKSNVVTPKKQAMGKAKQEVTQFVVEPEINQIVPLSEANIEKKEYQEEVNELTKYISSCIFYLAMYRFRRA